ncbi:MAG: electron transport complex subunit E [Oscillospiraceae bacterium]|nr:electron transport complex subunit E [Oscillospiraceae bacterium]MBR6616701.1 electron transport complex subunit E [Oscillospiraceae bacterium]
MKQNKFSAIDGLFRRNAVLAEGMVIAPIVVCCDTLPKALILSLAFACITFLSVSIASFFPKSIPYALRIILYAITSSLIYIPVAMLCSYLNFAVIGMYLPLLTVNSFVVLHSELYFYKLQKRLLLPALFLHIAGFCLTAVIIGLVREILAYGTICGRVVDVPVLMQGLSAPWAGFILLGILCAVHRKFFPKK